jgi:hypothetical protein
MKTIIKGAEVLRVKDEEAYQKVTKEGYKYCPKSEFKGTKTQPKKEIKK